MPLVSSQGLQLIHETIVKLLAIRDANAAASSTTASTSTTSTTAVTPSLSQRMVTETIAMLVRLHDNNSVDYWRVKANHEALVEWLHLLDNNRFTFVPVVFNIESRALAGVLLDVLQKIELDKHLDASSRVPLTAMVTLAGGDPAKALRILTDNLALNIALYDMVDSRQKNEAAIQALKKNHIAPVNTFFEIVFKYVDHLTNKKAIPTIEGIAEVRQSLQLPADCTELIAIYRHIANEYNQRFANVAQLIDTLEIPYSTLTEVDAFIKCKEPLGLAEGDDTNGWKFKNYFKSMDFYGDKSLLVRNLVAQEQGLAKEIGIPLQGMAQYYRDKYSPNAAQAIFDEFAALTRRLSAAVDVYLNPQEKSASSFFRNPVAAVKASVTTKMMNAEKRKIAERLVAACSDALVQTNPAMKKEHTISSRVFSVFKALLSESMAHAFCVGNDGISFGKLGDIFNEYLLAYYALFMKVDFTNDPYVQAQLGLQDNLVLPGVAPASATASTSVVATKK